MGHRNIRIAGVRGSTNLLELTPDQQEIIDYLLQPKRRTLAAHMLLNATTQEEQDDILHGIRQGKRK